MTPDEIRQLIDERLAELFMGSDKFVFQKHLQLFDGRHIQVGKTTGTKLGTETTQKLGFYGKTPVVQAATITAPTVTGAAQDSDARTAIGLIITALHNIGIIG